MLLRCSVASFAQLLQKTRAKGRSFSSCSLDADPDVRTSCLRTRSHRHFILRIHSQFGHFRVIVISCSANQPPPSRARPGEFSSACCAWPWSCWPEQFQSHIPTRRAISPMPIAACARRLMPWCRWPRRPPRSPSRRLSSAWNPAFLRFAPAPPSSSNALPDPRLQTLLARSLAMLCV